MSAGWRQCGGGLLPARRSAHPHHEAVHPPRDKGLVTLFYRVTS